MSLFYIPFLQYCHVEPDINFYSLTAQPIILIILTQKFKLKSMSLTDDTVTYLDGPFYLQFLLPVKMEGLTELSFCQCDMDKKENNTFIDEDEIKDCHTYLSIG